MPSARAALFAVPLALGVLGTAVAPAGATSHHHRPSTSLTCRGEGVDPKAAVRYKIATLIHAPLSTVWKLQTQVERWPSWQAHVEGVKRLDHGRFREGSAFHWTTPVPATSSTPASTMGITSTVQQLKRNSCLRWTGPADSEGIHIDGTHVWNFTKVRDGVLVRTEETHTGPQVDANVPEATAILKAGLDTWVSELKTAAEARSGCRH
ncbi:SRPBCC family protein [Streptomyces sp. NPDC050610]|uniref:SRPBCC family protein n=1 Tax=Streptomyces sp. NPDC050610 TaxID=3157097 RepID=UPI003432E042